MLKTVDLYETETQIFAIKVRTKLPPKEPACVNIFDTSDENYEEFAIIPVDSNLEPLEDYVKRRRQKIAQQRNVALEQDDETFQNIFKVPANPKCFQKCSICGKMVNNIKQHLKNHEKEKEMCNVCNRSVRKMLRHRHSCNLKLYGCLCGVSFALKGEIEAHMREYGVAADVHKLQCRRCPAVLGNTDEFDQHLANVHKILICLQCYKQFLTPEALAGHIENHAVHEVIKCSCSVELASRKSLMQHVNNIHLTREKIICPLCCINFGTREELRRHIEALHEDRKDRICTVCAKLFSQASSVVHHMSVHTEHRPFKCAFCFRSFKLSRNLRKHNVAHKEFMIKCPSCETFHLNQQELSLHLKRHPSHRK